MVTPPIPLPDPEDENNFLRALVPNRGRTKFVRDAILLFLAGGALGSIVVAAKVFSEFHARRTWPVAQGYVTDVRVKTYSGPSL